MYLFHLFENAVHVVHLIALSTIIQQLPMLILGTKCVFPKQPDQENMTGSLSHTVTGEHVLPTKWQVIFTLLPYTAHTSLFISILCSIWVLHTIILPILFTFGTGLLYND